MAVRQELFALLHEGQSRINVEAEYTGIQRFFVATTKKSPVLHRNLETQQSRPIRAGNVWVDIQQVFYRMEENVSGCYAQKPLKSVERIVRASSNKRDVILDLFAHSGSTLLAAEDSRPFVSHVGYRSGLL